MKQNANSKIVIVGGGIGGLFSARYLAFLGYQNITLIDKSDSPGGLLRNSVFSDSETGIGQIEFDLGTHFILKTGIPELDDVLDLELDPEKYIEFKDSLHEGQYTAGHLYTESGCLNVLNYPSSVSQAVNKEIADLLNQPRPEISTLKDLLSWKYGATACNEILTPVLQKLAGETPDKLDPTVEDTFFPSRLFVNERDKSIELKKIPGWDERIAFASFRDSTSSILKYYPKFGTVDVWLEDLISSLKTAGVRVLSGTEPSAIEKEGKYIRSITTSGNETLDCDYLIWTIPPILLARTLDIEVPGKKPTMRSVTVFHFVSDKKPIEGPYWINVIDPAKKAYRVTLYDNFSPNFSIGKHRLSVEVLHDGSMIDTATVRTEMFGELQEMEIIPIDSNCRWSGSDIIPNGFPVMQPGDVNLYDKQIKILSDSLENLHMVSRFRGGTSGQMTITANLFHHINGNMIL